LRVAAPSSALSEFLRPDG